MISPRKIVQELQPYPAPAEGRYGAIRLDFNENTAGFPGAYPAGIPAVKISAYPEYCEFIEKVARKFSVEANMVLPTCGSDEALQLVAQTFVESGEVAVISKPCFAVMPQCLRLAGARIIEVPVLADLSFDLKGIEANLQNARIAMFATPENPTGAVIPPAVIEGWAKKFPNTLFVIDEAYTEYYGESVLALAPKFENLLVMRTFSKAWGMAGLRLGLLFGQSYLLDAIKRIKLPYSVNSAAMVTASALLDRSDEVLAEAKATLKRKELTEEVLRKQGFTIVSGFANSFLLKLDTQLAKEFAEFAKVNGVLVRLREQVYVRVSVGTEAEMATFLDVVSQFQKRLVQV